MDTTDVTRRAAQYAALGDPARLAIVDDLALSDRSPTELGERHGLSSNLLAHHLGVLERAGLLERHESSGDRRRRYVRLQLEALAELRIGLAVPDGPVLFICTHNSARSQLAAELWTRRTGRPAESAGTHPADRVHPGAVAAAARAGLDLSEAHPRRLDEVAIDPSLVVTVCDQAHEELTPGPSWWHWSIPDPVDSARPDSFDLALSQLQHRVETLTGGTRP
jgi:protein-tyrosine-phosphatase